MNFQQFVDAVAEKFWNEPTYDDGDGPETQSLLSAAIAVSRQVDNLGDVLALIVEASEDPKVDVDRFGKHDGPSGDDMVEYQQVVLATAAQVRLTADEDDASAINDEERRRLNIGHD